MEKFVKLMSVQAGPFTTPSNRMIDFDIPEGHIVDMSKSFIQLVCSIDPATEFKNTPCNLCVKSTVGDDYNVMNLELIKNCYMNGGKVGQLENIRRVNILKKNLLELSKTSSQKLSEHNSLFAVKTFDNKKLFTPFVEFHKVGTVPSSYRNASLRIPMSHLFELGAIEVFDTNKIGKVRCHLELDSLETLVLSQVEVAATNDTACNDIAGGGAVSIFTLTKKYDTLEASPFWVGQKVDLAYTLSGTIHNITTVIAGITYDESSGTLTIATEYSIDANPNAKTNISIVNHVVAPLPASLGAFNVLTAEICLAELDAMKVESPNELQYLTFTTEEYSVGSTWMNKVFEVEPNAVNVWCMFHKDGAANAGNNLSVNNDLVSYRLRNDTVDIVDRDVKVNKKYTQDTIVRYVHDGLHYDLVGKLCKNGSYPLSNVSFVEIARNETTKQSYFTQPINRVMVLGSPVPQTVNNKKYQINLTNADGENIDNVILYKQIMRTLKL